MVAFRPFPLTVRMGRQIGAVALNGFYGEGGVDTELPTDPLQVEG
jgi:hypothetical protein